MGSMTMDELEKLCDNVEDAQSNFEDLVYHEALEILKRSAGDLWLSNVETTKLTMKANISSVIRILEHWDELGKCED